MSTWNLGSAATHILGIVENVPSTISGNVLLQLIDIQRAQMEDYTGLTIGSTSIQERFQSPLVDLSISALLQYMSVTGVDASQVSIGDFSVSKGAGSNLVEASNLFKERGMEQLKNIGWRFANYQAL